jgi:hypothetical protein
MPQHHLRRSRSSGIAQSSPNLVPAALVWPRELATTFGDIEGGWPRQLVRELAAPLRQVLTDFIGQRQEVRPTW